MSEAWDVIDGGGDRAGGKPRRQGHRLRRRHRPHSLPLLPPRSRGDDRLRPRAVDRAFRAHPDGGVVDPKAARVLGLPDCASGRDDPEACAQHFDHPAYSFPRRTGADVGGLHHRRLRPPGDGRRFRHRHHRLSHPGDDQLPGHHEGRDPHRRGRGALHTRRHSRQADGDRRRPLGRPHRREGGAGSQARARGRKRLLRLDGRRIEIRPRRRDRRNSSFLPSTSSAASSSASPATA